MEVSFEKSTAPAIDVPATVVPVAAPAVAETPAPTATVTEAPPTPATTIPTTSAVAVVAPVAAPAVAVSSPIAFDDENLGFEDIILPRINIVQKVGDLSNIFNGGEIVLNQTNVIHVPKDAKAPAVPTGDLVITVLGFRKRQFTEKVAGGKLGLLLNNEADIEKNNGTLNYNEWKQSVEDAKTNPAIKPKRRFERLATALVLVQKPESLKDDDQVLFPYECEGKFYTLALWSMKGISYTNAAKILFTAKRMGHLRSTGYAGFQYLLTSKLEDYDGNFAYKPVLTAGPKNTEVFRNFASKDVLGN